MVRPEHWTGSNLERGPRAEVVRYLKERGGEVRDDQGLAAAKMRDDMDKGRALTMLLADMEADGMIERDVRGRRTYAIKLVNDWGLATEARPKLRALEPVSESVPVVEAPTISEDTDLERLAEHLLALVIRRATTPKDEAEIVKWRTKTFQLESQLEELQATRAERDSLLENVRVLENNLKVLQQQLDKPRRGSTSIRERLSDRERRELDRLMRALPAGTKGGDG